MLHSFPGQYGHARLSLSRTNTAVTGQGTNTTGTTAHVWTTPTQLIASTSFDTHAICFRTSSATATSNTRSDTLVEIMIGGSGAETSLIGPVSMGHRSTNTTIMLPVFVPVGSRISVRFKSNLTSKGFACFVDLFGSPGEHEGGLPTRWVSYGLVNDASNSHGTAFTPGTSNAWGSWTAITTSTDYAHSLWVPQIDGYTAASMTALNYRSQFAIGTTSEAATMVTNGTVLEGPMWASTTGEQQTEQFSFGAWYVGLAVGSQPIWAPRGPGAAVSVRGMCSGTPDANAQGASILAAVM